MKNKILNKITKKLKKGKSTKTPAYLHSLSTEHHIFINLSNKEVYCLPEGYEVIDSSLEDIKYVLDPKYKKEEVERLDKKYEEEKIFSSLDGKSYIPGIVGLNNIKENDSINVILMSILHVKPIRNFLLLNKFDDGENNLLKEMSSLCRKLWNPKNFKNHVSPHEILQAITLSSKKKFRIGEKCNSLHFFNWIINQLEKDLSAFVPGKKLIDHSFRGTLKMTTEKFSVPSEQLNKDNLSESHISSISTKTLPFLMLTIDIPQPPLFKDDVEQIIPQVKKKKNIFFFFFFFFFLLFFFFKTLYFFYKFRCLFFFFWKNLMVKNGVNFLSKMKDVPTKLSILHLFSFSTSKGS